MGKITVIAPMEGTPASKMGVRAGDIISAIEDDEIKEDASTDEVVKKLRGPKGSQVTITIRRPGLDEPIRMTITRAEIPTLSVPYAFLVAPETGYILLRDFTHTSSRELASAITGARAVVVPEAGHMIVQEQPERFFAELESFLITSV